MFATLSRPYKEQSAAATIKKINSILNEVDLVPEEVCSANPYQEIFWSSIALPPEQGGFRTNGKGRSRELSLASAYAEYMERMQNLLFATFSRSMAGRLKDEFGYYYYPDEAYLERTAFENLPADVLADFIRYSGQGHKEFITAYFDRIATNGMPGVSAIPFYDTRNRCLQLLPLNLLLITAGSNGMAAGNTQAEAIFQALCELMERWAAALIFYGQLTPPTVPKDFLALFPEENAIIEDIEHDGCYKVMVKDFSAGMHIPAVGLVVENPNTGRYRLNVGSDTSFQVALSRCLTEIFQGFQDKEQFDAGMLKIPEAVPDYFLQDDDEARNTRFHIFTHFTKDNSGVFPPALFGDSPGYDFEPSTFTPLGSYEEEVCRLVRFFHGNGQNVYIRDASFLGFPSVFVYVPEVSAQGRKSAPALDESGRFQLVDLDTIENLFFNLAHCASDQLTDIAEKLTPFEPAAPIVQLFNIELAPDSPWRQLNVAFVLTQIRYSLKEYGQALFHFKQFCSTRREIGPYYMLVKKYLEAKAEGKDNAQIREQLKSVVDGIEITHSVLEQVMSDMAEPYSIQSYTQLPHCPDCKNCHLYDPCQTRHRLELARTVYSNMSVVPQAEALEWVMTVTA